MGAATLKQKAFMRKLLVQFGVPWGEFNEPDQWKIGKEDAHCIITELLLLDKCGWGDLKDILSDGLEGKQVLKYVEKTIDELDENQADYDPTIEDWIDQQTYEDDIPQSEWIRESRIAMVKKEVVA